MKAKLKDVVCIITDKKSSSLIDVNNYVSTENILPNREGIRFPAKSLPRISKILSYQKNDVLVSNIRPYFKKIWFSDRDGVRSNDVLAFRTKNRKILLQKYLYLLLQSDTFFDYVNLTAKGTKMPRGDKKAILNFTFELPSISTQKKLINYFFAIESKIKLNNRINDNLLELLDTEFHHQFSHQTHFRREKIRDYVKITRGSSPRPIKNFLTTFGRPWIKISDISNLSSPYLYKTKQYISKLGISKSKTVIPGTLILSNSATPGIPVISKIVASVHDGWLIISDYKLMNRNWFYLFFRQIRQELLKRANGSVFDNLKISIVENFPINVPNKDLLKRFEKISDPIFSEMEKLQLENIRLTKIKEALLNLYF